jgi:hypothetical protein
VKQVPNNRLLKLVLIRGHIDISLEVIYIKEECGNDKIYREDT